jgi:hypothetical protein
MTAPGRMPTSIPRTKNILVMTKLQSVAGKTQQMSPVVHVHATNYGGCAFLSTDEVNRQHQKEASENCLREPFTDRNRNGHREIWCKCSRHLNLLGSRVPLK